MHPICVQDSIFKMSGANHDSPIGYCVQVKPFGDGKTGQTLAQVLACCLTAPSHYLNQCWLLLTYRQWRPVAFIRGQFHNRYLQVINHWNKLEYYYSMYSNLPGTNELMPKPWSCPVFFRVMSVPAAFLPLEENVPVNKLIHLVKTLNIRVLVVETELKKVSFFRQIPSYLIGL